MAPVEGVRVGLIHLEHGQVMKESFLAAAAAGEDPVRNPALYPVRVRMVKSSLPGFREPSIRQGIFPSIPAILFGAKAKAGRLP
jgi:hypothetical protein